LKTNEAQRMAHNVYAELESAVKEGNTALNNKQKDGWEKLQESIRNFASGSANAATIIAFMHIYGGPIVQTIKRLLGI